eukprot:TRINITY_DN112490_c0_g1_i1.p1 TRINITY_DN112490_c0_g1~~TRINITY_DN112490_c0_g1_i1.p1  ORF type:complete len:353 (-),score=27.71 TRINITY_DN112490_c0_g1_i1:143-1177(-)
MPNPILPLFWPISHVSTTLMKKDDDVPSSLKAAASLDVVGHLTSMVAATRSFLMAVACIYLLYDGYDYPAFGSAKTLSWSWMWPIVARNLLATWIICGFWDWFLYFSPLKNKLHKYKFNPVYPSRHQINHDAMMTTSASLTAAALEIGLCYGWANGFLPMERNLMDSPIWNLVWAVTITHWRIPHFYLIHRAMHPWKTKIIPDFGQFLYRHVHALHHKSYNPTAFSGTNMHPVESTLYYSASLIAVAFGCHPAIVIGCIVDCGVGAWLGHDGFQWPGSGDYFHQIHHAHFDCNYGASHVPIDKWVGTFAGKKEDVRRIWGKQKAGAEANETHVHAKSSAADRVE